jgi:hypothetical protein
MLTFVMFRADSITVAMEYYYRLFSFTYERVPLMTILHLLICILFLVIEWFGRFESYAVSGLGKMWPRTYRYALYYLYIVIIFLFGGHTQEFIYFQF